MLEDPTFWTAIAFVIVIGLLAKPVYKTVTSGLDGRAERIRSQLDEAQRLRDEAQELLADYQRKQREAQTEAERIIAQAKTEAERLTARAAEDLQAAVQRREAQATERIAQAEAQALAEVRAAAVDLAVAATAQLMRGHAGGEAGDRLVDEAIRDLEGKLQ